MGKVELLEPGRRGKLLSQAEWYERIFEGIVASC